MAYKYMINIVNESCYSKLYNHRLLKYFTYGFSIVLPELDIKKIQNKHSIKISDDFVFTFNYVDKNQILIESLEKKIKLMVMYCINQCYFVH